MRGGQYRRSHQYLCVGGRKCCILATSSILHFCNRFFCSLFSRFFGQCINPSYGASWDSLADGKLKKIEVNKKSSRLLITPKSAPRTAIVRQLIETIARNTTSPLNRTIRSIPARAQYRKIEEI